ncbi:MAG: amidohydrolase family protein [Myxococcota bacterium]|nr:amidohydrolase family protein [Myxococcota bacterium]
MLYDLVLKNGRIVDPAQQLDRVADIAILGGKIVAIEPNISRSRLKREINVAGLLVVPGLIDVHIHTNLMSTPESLDVDEWGVRAGCTRVVDAGETGAYNWHRYHRQITSQAKTRIHNWLQCVALGGPMFGLYNTDRILHHTLIDIDATVKLLSMYPQHIKGIKCYATPELWGQHDGSEILDKTIEICNQAKVPVYTHCATPVPDGGVVYGAKPMMFGEEVTAERMLDKWLSKMRPGDIICHVFTNLKGPWHMTEKRLSAGIKESYDRGILFDTARGSHNSYEALRGLLDHGLVPQIISSDAHASDGHDQWDRPANYDLPTCMSEMMAFGMSLEDVILRASTNPAKALGISEEAGSIQIGRNAELTVLFEREGKFRFADKPYTGGAPEVVEGKTMLTPVLTVLNGKVFNCNPAFLPDIGRPQMQEDVWSWMHSRPDRPHEYTLSDLEKKK